MTDPALQISRALWKMALSSTSPSPVEALVSGLTDHLELLTEERAPEAAMAPFKEAIAAVSGLRPEGVASLLGM